MAPEVLLEKKIDGRADIFSLGVILYEVLAGRHPFRADTFTATSDRILHAVPAPLAKLNPEVPAELERIVAKMLAKDPAERHATARDLLVDLRAVQRGVLYPPLRVTLPPQRARRRRALTAAALAVVALVLLSAGLWNFFGPVPPPRERVRIAVVPFVNQTGDERLEEFRLTLTQILTHDLAESPNIRVLPYERLLDITRGFKTQGEDISSPEVIKALANYSNSQFVVVPIMFAVGSTARVQVEFRDAIAGERVGGTKVERVLSGSAAETFYSMLEELAGGIQQHFKDMGRGEDYRLRPEGSRPKTVAAALHLTKGRNASAQGNYAQALTSFQLAVNEDPGFALAYAWMGQIYGLLGYDDKARDHSEQAAQLISAQTPITDAYFIEANLAERKYNYSAAKEKYGELIRLYPDEPVWHAGLAEVYGKQGQYQKAIASYQEALRRDSTYIVAHKQLGSLYTRVSDYPRALEYAQKARDICRILDNQEGEAEALLVLGNALRIKGESQLAQQNFEAALAIFKKLRNEFGIVHARKLLGDVYFAEGKLRQALAFYQDALARSGEIQNIRIVAAALGNMGSIYYYQRSYSKAVEYYRQSLQVAARYRDDQRKAETLSNLGGLLIENGPNPEQGLEYVLEALSLFQSGGNKGWEAFAGMLLGVYYSNVGHYAQAMTRLRQSLAIANEINDKPSIASITYDIGHCKFLQNQYGLARDSLQRALEYFRSLNYGFDIARAQILLGRVDVRLGEFENARTTLTAVLRSVEENQYGDLLSEAYAALGELHYEEGNKDEARKNFRRAAALWTGEWPAAASVEAKSYLGLLEADERNFPQALSDCQASFDQAQKMSQAFVRARTRLNLAHVYLSRKEYERTLQALGEMLSQGELSSGPELLAQAYYTRGRALEGLGRTDEAKLAYQRAQEVIRTLLRTIPVSHRESFAARRDIKTLLP
jgi:tetratricopeptide (TPR) repeat protein